MLDDEGANVSAGEKQLLTIARAFLARPSALLLDEANRYRYADSNCCFSAFAPPFQWRLSRHFALVAAIFA